MIGTPDNPMVFLSMPHAPRVMMWQEGNTVFIRYPEGKYPDIPKSWREHLNELTTCVKVILLSPWFIIKLGLN